MIRVGNRVKTLWLYDDELFALVHKDGVKDKPIKHDEGGRVWYEKVWRIPPSWCIMRVNPRRCDRFGEEKPIIERGL